MNKYCSPKKPGFTDLRNMVLAAISEFYQKLGKCFLLSNTLKRNFLPEY